MPGRLALALKPSVRGSLRASLSIWVRNRLCLACMGVLLQAWSLAAAGTNTLPDDWVIRGWQTESGLPHNTVSALAQTRDGYLWAGTEGGLARFDGVEFRTFGLDDGLGSVRISKLFEDSQGVLWVGTEGGGLSRYEDGHFTTFTNRDGSVADTITALSEGVDGSLWVGTESGLYAWHDGVFTVPNGAVELQKRRVRALARDFSGKTWVSTLLEGLFQQTSGLFAPVRGGPPSPRFQCIASCKVRTGRSGPVAATPHFGGCGRASGSVTVAATGCRAVSSPVSRPAAGLRCGQAL